MALMHVISVFNLITVYRKHMMRFYKVRQRRIILLFCYFGRFSRID